MDAVRRWDLGLIIDDFKLAVTQKAVYIAEGQIILRHRKEGYHGD